MLCNVRSITFCYKVYKVHKVFITFEIKLYVLTSKLRDIFLIVYDASKKYDFD